MRKVRTIIPGRSRGRSGVAVVAAVSLVLSGCAQGGLTRESRIGSNDGTDSCYPQAAALDSTGNFFAQDILTGAVIGALGGAVLSAAAGGNAKQIAIGTVAGAAVGGAAGYWGALQQQSHDQRQVTAQVQADLYKEGVQIDKTQVAFNQLMDCRYAQAARIRADLAAGRIDRAAAQAAMATVRARTQQDIALAKQIDGQINDRGGQFNYAVDNIQPGTVAQVTPVSTAPPRPLVTRRPAPLKLRPDPSSPDVAMLPARASLTAEHARGNYALVQTSTGVEGYVASADLQGSVPPPPAPRGTRTVQTASASSGAQPPPVSRNDDVKTLAGSNAARRDTFAETVAVNDKNAQSSFELAS
jgi:hypothetical protein